MSEKSNSPMSPSPNADEQAQIEGIKFEGVQSERAAESDTQDESEGLAEYAEADSEELEPEEIESDVFETRGLDVIDHDHEVKEKETYSQLHLSTAMPQNKAFRKSSRSGRATHQPESIITVTELTHQPRKAKVTTIKKSDLHTSTSPSQIETGEFQHREAETDEAEVERWDANDHNTKAKKKEKSMRSGKETRQPKTIMAVTGPLSRKTKVVSSKKIGSNISLLLNANEEMKTEGGNAGEYVFRENEEKYPKLRLPKNMPSKNARTKSIRTVVPLSEDSSANKHHHDTIKYLGAMFGTLSAGVTKSVNLLIYGLNVIIFGSLKLIIGILLSCMMYLVGVCLPICLFLFILYTIACQACHVPGVGPILAYSGYLCTVNISSPATVPPPSSSFVCRIPAIGPVIYYSGLGCGTIYTPVLDLTKDMATLETSHTAFLDLADHVMGFLSWDQILLSFQAWLEKETDAFQRSGMSDDADAEKLIRNAGKQIGQVRKRVILLTTGMSLTMRQLSTQLDFLYQCLNSAENQDAQGGVLIGYGIESLTTHFQNYIELLDTQLLNLNTAAQKADSGIAQLFTSIHAFRKRQNEHYQSLRKHIATKRFYEKTPVLDQDYFEHLSTITDIELPQLRRKIGLLKGNVLNAYAFIINLQESFSLKKHQGFILSGHIKHMSLMVTEFEQSFKILQEAQRAEKERVKHALQNGLPLLPQNNLPTAQQPISQATILQGI